MKASYCKFIGCRRLVTATTVRGEKPYAQCNQQVADGAVWFMDCEVVAPRQCLELQRALRQHGVVERKTIKPNKL